MDPSRKFVFLAVCVVALLLIGTAVVHGASRAYLARKYELDAAAIVRAVEELTGARTGIDTDELEHVPLQPQGEVERSDSL